MKRFVSFLLVLMLVVAMVPQAALAAGKPVPQITGMTLRPSCAGVYFTAELAGDTSQVDTWGVALSLAEMPSKTNLDTACLYTRTTDLGAGNSVLLTDVLSQEKAAATNLENGEAVIYGRPYAQLKDGSMVFGNGVTMSLKELLVAIDEIAGTLDETQTAALAKMYGDFIGITYHWDLVNIHASYGKGCALNSLDADALDISVQVLEDASYEGVDLASRMYQHAFTCSIKSHIEDALTKLADGSATSTLKAMVVNHETLTENKLMTGDIIFAGDELYLYGAGSLRSLNGAGAPKVDTAATLAGIEEFTLLRPANGYTSLKRSDVTAPKDVLTPEQEALIATAKAYWLRGERLQYADTRFIKNGKELKAEFRWQSTINSPEDCTLTDWGYTNCAVFTHEVYYQTFGVMLPDNMYTTYNLATYAAGNGTEVFAYTRTAGSTQTAAEQARVKEEFFAALQPGDIICIRRENSTGHALLYIGDGQILHSGGSTYEYTGSYGIENYEASIRRVRVDNYFFNPNISSGGDFFTKGTKLSIVRPLKVLDLQVNEATQNRMENLDNIVAEKLSSHVRAQTADQGEAVTFTYAMHNIGKTPVTLEIRETVPQELEWVSGGDRNGDQLSWTVTVPAEGRASVSYTAKVKDNVPYGTTIQSTDSTVGGVTTKCEPITVGKKLTAAQQEALIAAYQSTKAAGTSLTGLALVNELYKQATGVEKIFTDTTFTTVTEGTNGCFRYYTTNADKSIYELNPGSKYAKMLAPSLYGGYRLWASEFAGDRTRLPKPQDLQVGDVIMGKTSSSTVIYLYLGEEIGCISASTLKQDTTALPLRLERLLAYGNYFAIMRPMQALQ